MRYRYTTIYAISGGISQNVEPMTLVSPNSNVEALVTSNWKEHATQANYSLAIAELLLSGLFRAEPGSQEFRTRLENKAAEISRRSAADAGGGPFLVINAEGTLTRFEPSNERDAGDFIVCFDGIDKESIKHRLEPSVVSVISALIINVADISSIKRVSEVILGYTDDERLIYSYSPQVGGARIQLSRPLTVQQSLEIAGSFVRLSHDESLGGVQRMLCASFEENDDYLRAFLFAWLALEFLVEELSQLAPSQGMERRFGAIASELSPQSSEGDVATFSCLHRLRNDLVHGRSRTVLGTSVEVTRGLVARYLRYITQ